MKTKRLLQIPHQTPLKASVKVPAKQAQSAVNFMRRKIPCNKLSTVLTRTQNNIDKGIMNSDTKTSALLAKSWNAPVQIKAYETDCGAKHHSLPQNHINDALKLQNEVATRR